MATSVENGQSMTMLSPSRPFSTEFHTSEEDAEEIDDRLPQTRARNGKWWYAAFHNVTAIVGAGVLGLPTAMVYLGWGGGVVVLVMSWVITLFTLWQMVQMHEIRNENGEMERIDTYSQLGQKAFGPRLGLWIVLPQQIIVQVGVNIVYMLTGGHALWQFYQLVRCPQTNLAAMATEEQCCGKLGKTTFIIFFAFYELVLAQLGNFNSIASISLFASITCIGYCLIAWIDSLQLGKSNHGGFANSTQALAAVCPTSYKISHDKYDSYPHMSKADQVFGVFSALGVIAFSYAGHNVVLEIQATLPSTPQHPAKERMWRGVMVAYIIVAICYFPVAFAGYWAFGTALTVRGISPGNPRSGNILLQLGEPSWLIAIACFFVAIHVSGSYLVYAMPMFDLIEKVLKRSFGVVYNPHGHTSMTRIVTRSTYVLFTAFIAMALPFFDDLLAFVGGFALTPTTYFLPCIIWLKLKKPKVFSPSWLINVVLIVIGVLLTLIAITGGLRSMIVDASIKLHIVYLNCTNTLQYPEHCTTVRINASSHYEFFNDFICKQSASINSIICQVHFD